MNTYKITNITNLASKRDMKFNSTLDIDYVDNMIKKTIKVKPGETVFLTISSLPLSVHRLRVKKLISVVEIGKVELDKTMNTTKPTTTVKESVEAVDKKNTTTIKKKGGRKSHDDETRENGLDATNSVNEL